MLFSLFGLMNIFKREKVKKTISEMAKIKRATRDILFLCTRTIFNPRLN